LIKKCGPKVVDWVFKLVRSMWRTGSKPKAFKTALMRLIHKKGSKTEADNYRPISLICTLDKIYGIWLKGRVTEWVEEEDLIPDAYGGLTGRPSTEEMNYIISSLVEISPGQVHAAFLDISKAFDSVERDILWKKLRDMGMAPQLLNAIRSLYAGTQIKIKVSTGLSEPFQSTRGVRRDVR
jgi:hypothetical protein